MSDKIPVPITFNPHKHHLEFLKEKINNWKSLNWESVEKEILCIGNNLVDFYLGSLQVEEICNECINYFRNEKITEKECLLFWLKPLKHKKIQLSDKSFWLIKEGIDGDRFIHIHPAKYSPSTIRVRAITLKTVIALKVHSISIDNGIKANLQNVNRVRTEFLKLSPIKSLQPEKGILHLWELFDKN